MGQLVYVEKATPTDSEGRRQQEQRIIQKTGAIMEMSTTVGGTATLESAAEKEDKFINGMIDLLSSMSEEDADRVLLKIGDGVKLSRKHLDLTTGAQVGVAKAGIGFPGFDAAFDALMAKHDVSVTKAEGPLPYLDRGRWQ